MPKGKGHRFTTKEDKLANDIAKEYQKKGYPKNQSKAIGYATVNKVRNR